MPLSAHPVMLEHLKRTCIFAWTPAICSHLANLLLLPMASRSCQKPTNFLGQNPWHYQVTEIVGSVPSGNGRVSWKKLQFLLLILEFLQSTVQLSLAKVEFLSSLASFQFLASEFSVSCWRVFQLIPRSCSDSVTHTPSGSSSSFLQQGDD